MAASRGHGHHQARSLGDACTVVDRAAPPPAPMSHSGFAPISAVMSCAVALRRSVGVLSAELDRLDCVHVLRPEGELKRRAAIVCRLVYSRGASESTESWR